MSDARAAPRRGGGNGCPSRSTSHRRMAGSAARATRSSGSEEARRNEKADAAQNPPSRQVGPAGDGRLERAAGTAVPAAAGGLRLEVEGARVGGDRARLVEGEDAVQALEAAIGAQHGRRARERGRRTEGPRSRDRKSVV